MQLQVNSHLYHDDDILDEPSTGSYLSYLRPDINKH